MLVVPYVWLVNKTVTLVAEVRPIANNLDDVMGSFGNSTKHFQEALVLNCEIRTHTKSAVYSTGLLSPSCRLDVWVFRN
jgi:hypothetical protein